MAKLRRELLSDIATHRWQICRELFIVGAAAEWPPQSLRDFCFLLFGGPMTTKQSLESNFNTLSDKGRGNKAKAMSSFTRYSYAILNPHATSGGLNLTKCDESDFASLAINTSELRELQNLNIFSGVRSAKLPAECPSRKELKVGWSTVSSHFS